MNRVLLLLVLNVCCLGAMAQGDAVFEVKAKSKTTPVASSKYRSVVLPKYDTAGLNYLLIDTAIGKGDTIVFFDRRIKLNESFIQTGQGATLKQHMLKGNVIDGTTAFILRYARMSNQAVSLIVSKTSHSGSLRSRDWLIYQIRVRP